MAINSEQIDLARSLLYAFAELEDDETEVSSVHFNRVSNKSDYFEFEDDFLEHLKLLEILGEASQVKPNFWSITPTRSVKFSDKWLIVSSKNNHMLRDLVEFDVSETLCRFSSYSIENYPKQNLSAWMGVPSSLVDWVRDLRNAAMAAKNLKHTTQNPGELQYYAPWLKTRSEEWLEFSEIKGEKNDLFLARTKDKELSREYFWFKSDQSGSYQSSFDRNFLIQSMLGLRMMNGCKGWALNLTSLENKKFKLVWPNYYPASLEKLVIATSIFRVCGQKETEYILESGHIETIAHYLNNVGLMLRKF